MHILGKEYATKLVIFDKDGTLIDFAQTWIGIIGNLLTAMGEYVLMTEPLRIRVQEALGISVDHGTIDGSGPLAMGTFNECDALLTYCLYREGIRWDEAQDIVRKLGDEIFRSDVRDRCIRPAKGAKQLLARLKDKGIHIAVATNDKAKDALSDMVSIGVAPYIDIVIGADSVENSKPAPDMVMKICEHFHSGTSHRGSHRRYHHGCHAGQKFGCHAHHRSAGHRAERGTSRAYGRGCGFAE